MPQRKHKFIVVVVTAIILTSFKIALAGDLRGQVISQSYRGSLVPRQGVEVELTREGENAPSLSAISGVNGTFYFYSIPPGNYNLSINGQHIRPVTVEDVPFQDLGEVKQQ